MTSTSRPGPAAAREINHASVKTTIVTASSQQTHRHTHPFNGPLSGTTRVNRYQKGKTSPDFTEATDSEWHRHQLGHKQVCTSLHTDNHASTPLLFFYRLDALPAAQPTASSTEGITTTKLYQKRCRSS